MARRLSQRDRINIASGEDTLMFDSYLEAWLASLPGEQILRLDVSGESLEYRQSVKGILGYLGL